MRNGDPDARCWVTPPASPISGRSARVRRPGIRAYPAICAVAGRSTDLGRYVDPRVEHASFRPHAGAVRWPDRVVDPPPVLQRAASPAGRTRDRGTRRPPRTGISSCTSRQESLVANAWPTWSSRSRSRHQGAQGDDLAGVESRTTRRRAPRTRSVHGRIFSKSAASRRHGRDALTRRRLMTRRTRSLPGRPAASTGPPRLHARGPRWRPDPGGVRPRHRGPRGRPGGPDARGS